MWGADIRSRCVSESTDYLPLAAKHSLRNVLDGLLVVVQACAKRIQEVFGSDVSQHPGYRKALIEASIVTNAALAAYSIQQEFGTNDPTGLQAVYGVYLLETRQVWAPRVSEMKGIGLAAAPRDPRDLGNSAMRYCSQTGLHRLSEPRSNDVAVPRRVANSMQTRPLRRTWRCTSPRSALQDFVTGSMLPPGLALGSPVKTKQFSFVRLVSW